MSDTPAPPARMPVITCVELDAATCSTPGCDHSSHDGVPMTLAGRCHPESATVCAYLDGLLSVKCATCNTAIALVAVASTLAVARADRQRRVLTRANARPEFRN
jgi:LSD1 subclass zinc finger protein